MMHFDEKAVEMHHVQFLADDSGADPEAKQPECGRNASCCVALNRLEQPGELIRDDEALVPDRVGAEDEESTSADDDLIRPNQIGIPIAYAHVWNSVDLDGETHAFPCHVEVIATVLALDSNLS